MHESDEKTPLPSQDSRVTIFSELGLPEDAGAEEIAGIYIGNIAWNADTMRVDKVIGDLTDLLTAIEDRAVLEGEKRIAALETELAEARERLGMATEYLVYQDNYSYHVITKYWIDDPTWTVYRCSLVEGDVIAWLDPDSDDVKFSDENFPHEPGCGYLTLDAAFAALATWKAREKVNE